jgi:hypothetical protein
MNLMLRRKLSRYIETGAICALGSDIHEVSEAYRYYAKAMNLWGIRAFSCKAGCATRLV